MSSVPASPCTQRSDNKEKVSEDRHHDGDHVQGDPAPLVVIVDGVGDCGPRVVHHVTVNSRLEVVKGVDVLGRDHVTEHVGAAGLGGREVGGLEAVHTVELVKLVTVQLRHLHSYSRLST